MKPVEAMKKAGPVPRSVRLWRLAVGLWRLDLATLIKNLLMHVIDPDKDDDRDTIFYMPLLPKALADEFGHDGQGYYSGNYGHVPACEKGQVLAPKRKREFKLPWHEAGPPNHLDDNVDSDQQFVNKSPSL